MDYEKPKCKKCRKEMKIAIRLFRGVVFWCPNDCDRILWNEWDSKNLKRITKKPA